MRRVVVLVVLAATAACATREVPMPAPPTTLRYPDYLYPTVPGGTDSAQATRVERGWRFLQGDSQRNAEREFQAALQAQPAFHPAATGLGYVELARRDAKDAVVLFDRALDRSAAYVPALVGRGQALLELGRDSEALASFEAAVKADPKLIELQSRIDVLRFRAVQGSLARAKAASEGGRLPEARAAYQQAIAASPDSAFLYRELAAVERKAGDPAAALQNYRKAATLEPNDAPTHAQIGALLEAEGDSIGALASYERARKLDPNEVPLERITRIREAAAAARLPAQYRAIGAAASTDRADVAALVGVRLAALIAGVRPRQAVVTDIRGHWAQQWITPVVRAGVMDTQPNYAFQPDEPVRRGDLAQTVARVLALIARARPGSSRAWDGAKPKVADVSPGHLSYAAVSAAVASGVMPLENGAFQLLRPVSGGELIAVVTRLEKLAK